MSTSTVVSSLESIPLPPAAPQIRRRVKESKAADRSQAFAKSDSAELGFVTFDSGRKYLARIVGVTGRTVTIRRYAKKTGEWQTKNESREREACIPLTAAEAEASFPGSVVAWDEAAQFATGSGKLSGQDETKKPEPQCQHLSRTDVGKSDSGRQVCDDCKQIFQHGFPVKVVPPVAVVPEPVEAAEPPVTVTEAPTPTVKTTTLSLLPIFTADQPTKLRKADMDVHRARIKGLNPEDTLATTIAGFKLLDHATEIGDLYLAACQQHFDNRGHGSRIISGFNGFQDFVERGLGGHIRTIQRRLKKFHDPEAAALKAKEENEKRRLAAAAQKQQAEKAQAADALELIIEEFEKRAARYEKYFNNGEITPANWLDLLRDEKKRCDLPEWVTRLDTVIAHAKTVIAAKTETVEVEPVIDQPEPTTPEEPISVVVTTEDRLAAIVGYVLAEVRRFGDGTEMLGEVISKLMIEHEKALAE